MINLFVYIEKIYYLCEQKNKLNMVHYYTNIKQSKKLIELGLNSETAYMVYRMEFNPYDNIEY